MINIIKLLINGEVPATVLDVSFVAVIQTHSIHFVIEQNLIYLNFLIFGQAFEVISSALGSLTVVCHSMTQRPDLVFLLSG